MIPNKEIFEDVVLDNINAPENGDVSYARFNRLSKRGELRMLDFLSGDINNATAPLPYLSQKNKDWLSPFIEKYPVQVIGGKIVKPANYYMFENMYLLGTYNNTAECDEETEDNGLKCNTIIELLSGAQYNARCKTFIEGLQPSFEKPIAKLVRNSFEYNPSDIGSITLEYVRYPIFGKIVTKMDNVYNEEVIDETLSTNYEWDEYARELLVYFITDTFAIHTRENALKQQNQSTQKLVRG